MNRQWITAAAAALLAVWVPRQAASQDRVLEEIVAEFFPQRLITESQEDHARGGPPPFQASAFLPVDLQGDGSAFIVATYTNGFSGVVRALRKVGVEWQLVDEPRLPLLGGVLPSVAPLNLDADAIPEILVSLSSARGPRADWVFDWDGLRLRPINPTVSDETGEIDTVLSDADFLDLDGDGLVEMINPTGSGPVAADEVEPIGVGDFDVYSFDGERFVLRGPVASYGSVVRRTGPPVSEQIGFSARAPGSYLLRLVNGTSRGADRVSSAVIRLNGEQVAAPSRFNQNVERLDIAVALQEENLLEIELRGSPGGLLTYSFEPAP